MNKVLLDALRCPYCSGKLTVTHGEPHSGGWEYAVLSCFCEQYPVVAGIPIIKKGVLGIRGPSTRTVNQYIMSGKNQDALVATMMPVPGSAELAPKWLKDLPQVKGMSRIKSVFGKYAMSRWARLAKEFILAGPQGRTALDYFRFRFLRAGEMKEAFNYFTNRFGQPRQLVALSLMTLIKSPRKPVLDFGCGFGHLTCHLVRRVGQQTLIAADLNFTRLYVAKNFLAPEALYVCCDGDTSWPFIDQFFSAAYTSDTLYMVTNKVLCSRELQRVVDSEGLIIVPGIRNRLVDPQKYPTSLPHYTYRELFDSMPQRILANSEVLGRYVTKHGPILSRSSEGQTLDSEPWFSLVATKHEELLVDQGSFEDWPHAEGVLELNPLYERVENHGEETLYRHKFPSSWYEQEDGDCRKYEPESVSISSKLLRDLSSRKRTPDMEDLIAQCVIVGIPDRFH